MKLTAAALLILVAGAPLALAQPAKPVWVQGYVISADIEALAPAMKAPGKAAPEAQALMGALHNISKLSSRFTLVKDISRQEIVSTDFVLPAGTQVMHKGGDRFYVIADPKAKNYVVMDASELLTALEGGAGIVNTQYSAKVEHTSERREIAGYPSKKSILTVSYASAIPFENDRILVQQQNQIEIWHTAHLVSAAAMDHLFFRFQQDKTGTCRRVVGEEIGFPMEVRFVITQAGAKKSDAIQPGSFHYIVTDVKQENRLDAADFNIPPTGFRKLEKNPYFASLAR
jgi:hypothetical protein